MLSRYQNLKPEYGAARADLFRYLLLYRYGGIYLDLKSTIIRPLDEVVGTLDSFIISQWNNGAGGPFAGYGLHKELSKVKGGEFQQWFLVSVPGHPFLKAVLEEVLSRINLYRPWSEAVGRLGVVRTTGPIPFTLAIQPLLDQYPHRRVKDETEVGFQYSFNTVPTAHVNSDHYWLKKSSITRGRGFLRPLFVLYSIYMWFARSYKVNKITLGLLPLNREL